MSYLITKFIEHFGQNSFFEPQYYAWEKYREDKFHNIEQYDLIVPHIPFLTQIVNIKNFDSPVRENWKIIYTLFDNLNNNGILVVRVEPVFITNTKFLDFIINQKKIFLVGLIQMIPGNKQGHIAIFSKNPNPKENLFIASLRGQPNIDTIFNNFLLRKSDNSLDLGDVVSIKNFKGFAEYDITKELDNIEKFNKGVERVSLKDIILQIQTTKNIFMTDPENTIYLYKTGKRIFTNLQEIEQQKKVYQIVIDKKIILAEYLKKYLSSELGQKSLANILKPNTIPIVDENLLLQMKISVPKLKIQQSILETYKLTDKINNIITELQGDLTGNPNSVHNIYEKLTTTLSSLQKLSQTDKITQYIRKGENAFVEFKQTFSLDIRTKEKSKTIELSSLKNIAGFLNTQGGSLLIGVADNGDITGIESDNYTTDDKYLLNFKNKIKEAMGEDLGDLITWDIVNVENEKILWVECQKSPKPIYIYERDFYVRTNPATDKLEGAKMVEYIKRHFK